MTQGLLHGAVSICFPKCDSPFLWQAAGGEEDKNGDDGYLYTE